MSILWVENQTIFPETKNEQVVFFETADNLPCNKGKRESSHLFRISSERTDDLGKDEACFVLCSAVRHLSPITTTAPEIISHSYQVIMVNGVTMSIFGIGNGRYIADTILEFEPSNNSMNLSKATDPYPTD